MPPFADFSGQGADDAPPPTMDIRAVFSGVLRRWPLIVGMPILFLLAVFAASKVIPPIYKAGVQVLIFDPQRPNMTAGAEPSQPMRELDAVAINTDIEVIKSAALSLRVVEELTLDQNPEFQQHRHFEWLRSKLAGYLGISKQGEEANDAQTTIGPTNRLVSVGKGAALPAPIEGQSTTAVDPRVVMAAAILNRHITVDRVPLSYVIVVSATSNNPKTAQILASQIVNDYVADQKELSEKGLSQLSVWLTAKIAELKSQMDETGTEIEKLKLEVGADTSDKGAQIRRQILDLNSQLMVARADLAGKRARLGQIQHGEGASTAGELESSYNAALRREQSLEANLERVRATQVDATTNVRLQELQRIADANAKLYDTYNARLTEVQNSLTLSIPGKRIISAATVPNEPSFPPTKLMFIGGGGLGLVVGVMLAFILTQLKAGIRPGAGAEQKFGYPIIGNVPLFRHRRLRGARRLSARDSLLMAFGDTELSPHGEAVRMIRNSMRPWNLDFAPKVILVTSAVPGEGKSSIATLLAAASAGARQRTVLVDCDFYGRTISNDFGRQQIGLADLLTRAARFDEVIQQDPSIGCFVISAGSSFRRRGDLLVSTAMAETVARLRKEFDYVVIDTPPLLSVSDTLAVAGLVDKIIVVVDASETRPEVVTEALRLLRSGRDRIAGIVLNKVAPDDLQRLGMYAYGYSDVAGRPPALPAPTGLSAP
jgi:succinoglycan biosynthesis transport protein ExoP